MGKVLLGFVALVALIDADTTALAPQSILNVTSTLNVQIIRQWTELVGCVDDADLLETLFSFGATGTNRADLNNDPQWTMRPAQVLFAFGNGC